MCEADALGGIPDTKAIMQGVNPCREQHLEKRSWRRRGKQTPGSCGTPPRFAALRPWGVPRERIAGVAPGPPTPVSQVNVCFMQCRPSACRQGASLRFIMPPVPGPPVGASRKRLTLLRKGIVRSRHWGYLVSSRQVAAWKADTPSARDAPPHCRLVDTRTAGRGVDHPGAECVTVVQEGSPE